MQGIVYRADGQMQVETVPDPTIVEPTDAIVRVTKASICGSDLHIYNHGEAFGFEQGCRVGHEFVGVVEEAGSDVRSVARGDKVLSPFWISCGECRFCSRGLHTSCVTGSCFGFPGFWNAPGDVQGGQSEYVRVPLADGTLDRVPEALADDSNDARTLPLSDVMGTAYHAVMAARPQPGGVSVIVGDGAVGLLAAHAATLFDQRAIVLLGHHDDRLAIGQRLGATHTANTSELGAEELVAELTGGIGAESVVCAIASPATMQFAVEVLQPGGAVGWTGMEVFFGAPEIPWDMAYLKNAAITGGVAPVKHYLPELWPHLEAGRIDPSPVLTHDLPLAGAAAGYPIMASREEGSVKVAVTP